MKASQSKRLSIIENALAQMVCVQVEIYSRETKEVIKKFSGKGAKHNIVRVTACF